MLRDSLRVYQTSEEWRVTHPVFASRFYSLHEPLPFEVGVKAAVQHQIEQHRRIRQRLQNGAGLRVAHGEVFERHLGSLSRPAASGPLNRVG